MANDEEREGSVVLRENGQVVGVTRGRKKATERRTRFSTAVRGDQAVDPAAIRKASEALITADGHSMTEEQALAKAAELASEAAQKFRFSFPKKKQGSGLGAVFQALKDRNKKSSNG